MGTIDIAFGVDATYAPHLAAAIASIVQASPHSTFRFLILQEGLSRETQARIEAAAGQKFHWLEVDDGDVPEFGERRHLTRATLYRLCLAKKAPSDCSRVIYLDADLVAVGDIAELWRTDLAGAPVAAVVDGYFGYEPFAERWGLDPHGVYFNAGVLLMDLAMVRDEGALTKALEFQAKHNTALTWDDQDALNWVFWKRWKPLSVAWNVQASQAIPSVERTLDHWRRLGDQAPKVVHFTGGDKPWRKEGYHPWSWLYWVAAMRSGFFADVVRANGITPTHLLRLYLRWLRHRPRGSAPPSPPPALRRPATAQDAPVAHVQD